MQNDVSAKLDEKLCKCAKQYLSYWPGGKQPIFKKSLEDFESKKEYVEAKKEFNSALLLMCPGCKKTITRKEYNEIVEKFILNKKEKELK